MLQFTRLSWFTLLSVVLILLSGCSGNLPGFEPTPTPTTPPTATAFPTATPTLTPTPLPPVGVLLHPEGADQQLADQLQNFLSNRITQLDMRFQVRPTLSRNDFERDEIQMVVALPPFDDLHALAASNPDTRFLAVGFNDLEPAANLTVIALPEDWFMQQAFMAGYIGMVITPDWRAGMIRVDTPEGELAARAFESGALFFCSSPSAPGQDLFCRPDYAPIYQYPIIAFGEPGTTPDEWPGVGRYMLNQFVDTIFISPEVHSDQLLRFLAQEEVEIIGSSPPLSDIASQWVASLEFDLFQTFQDYWPEFAAGTDAQLVPVGLTITNVNPELLSPGRQQFVERKLVDLAAGYVDYGLDSNVNNP